MALDLQGQILNGQWNIRQDVMVNARNFLQVAGMINRPERTEARMIDSIISCIIVCALANKERYFFLFFSFSLVQSGKLGFYCLAKAPSTIPPKTGKRAPAQGDEIASFRQCPNLRRGL